MLHKCMTRTIVGIAPLLLHNGQLADSMNPYAKAMKEITGKGANKTDADMRQLSDLEWEGGLYLDENRRVVIPGENIEAALIEGGKKKKLGDKFKAGVLSLKNWTLDYEGPKDFGALKADPRFRDSRGVVIKGSRITRTRPRFNQWSLTFEVHYMPDLLNEAQVDTSLRTVGEIIGIGDFTPKFGRFRVA